jgi:hypothetical protein
MWRLRSMGDPSSTPSIEGLVELACTSGVDIRPTLLRVLTDLYVQARSHTSAEQAQYVELALRLAESVDGATRATVAVRLAGYKSAPKAVLDRLQELGTQLPPAESLREPRLAEVFFAASEFERRFMMANIDIGLPKGAKETRAVAAETCRRLEAAALARDAGEVSRLLERTLSVPPDIARRIVEDPLGEPIVVAARALGMDRAALQRILLVMNPEIGHSVDKVYGLTALFDEMTPEAADAMVDIWRDGAAKRTPPSYRAALWNDEAPSARASATPRRYDSSRGPAVSDRMRNSGR